MVMYTANQVYVFMSTIYAGIIIGFLYDIYRMMRRITKPDYWVTGILDLSFWIIIAALSFITLFYVNDGEVRFYTYVGLGIGWVLYIFAFSTWVMKGMQWLYDGLLKIFRIFTKVLAWPVGFLINLIQFPWNITKKILGRLSSLLFSLKKNKVEKKKKNNKNIRG